MNLFTIPPDIPFLDALAAAWLAERGADPQAIADGLILLPTRRAARALAEAFLRASNGKPLLLPRITALGALDETPLALAGALDLPPGVDPVLRLAVLSRMILAMNGANGAPTTADRAWRLAQSLADLLDDAARAEVDLAARLPHAADDAFAQHWQVTLRFLSILTDAWPRWLAEEGLLDIAQRQIMLLDAQARAWTEQPPARPVWIAGATGAIPAVARLIRTAARLRDGRVVLPGLDLGMDEAAWQELEPSHPQAGMQRLLVELGATRGDVRPWRDGGPTSSLGRDATLHRALRPAIALGEWRRTDPLSIDGLYRLSAADQQEEATAIALILRNTLETPGRRGALVTPDRELAVRVTAELARFGVVADDSAGEKLAETPPAVFLRLLAAAIAERFAPVPLLSLLKHPLTAAGLAPGACRAAARALELACLRGPRPAPGLGGLRDALARSGASSRRAADLLDRLERCLAPILQLLDQPAVAPDIALTALIEAGEALAATDDAAGPARLWAEEEGQTLAALLNGLQAALPMLPSQPVAILPGLLNAAMQGAVVRSRRALRGRGGLEHPRVFIWGLLEARLQMVDVMVLGGLAEGVWPAATESGPWMSRPMLASVGLPSPEEIVGQMAHDFVAAACAAPVVVLSCPRRREGAPSVPARWLVRLEALLLGSGLALPEHPAVAWARALDQPDAPRTVQPPEPRPPVALRPRRLRVTEIEDWLRDPYTIYARHVLQLAPLPPLDEAVDAADYGTVVHRGLHAFLEEAGSSWPADGREQLRAALLRALDRAGLRPALLTWWRPRLLRIADWVAETEIARRAEIPLTRIVSEKSGIWSLTGPAGPFELRGRADRIEQRQDGSLAILDYKTGRPPSADQVNRGFAPQLVIEAAMAVAGAFGAELTGSVSELAYWYLAGGSPPGSIMTPIGPDAVAQAARFAHDNLVDLIARYDDPAQPYLSHPHPDEAPVASDYARLARVAEWALAENGG